MTADSVVVWDPGVELFFSSDPVPRLLRREGRPSRVLGSSGFGTALEEVPSFVWGDVTGVTGVPSPWGSTVLLVGAEGTQWQRRFEESFTEHPGTDVIHLHGAHRSSEGVLRKLVKNIGGEAHRRSLGGRLVVIEVDDPEAPVAVLAAELLGSVIPWSTLLVAPRSAGPFTRFVNEKVIRAIVLPEVDATEENGIAIASALAAGIETPGGVEAVLAGSPPEWVRSYELGEVNA